MTKLYVLFTIISESLLEIVLISPSIMSSIIN